MEQEQITTEQPEQPKTWAQKIFGYISVKTAIKILILLAIIRIIVNYVVSLFE